VTAGLSSDSMKDRRLEASIFNSERIKPEFLTSENLKSDSVVETKTF
jgi:hypothetical protein